jgi:hypothetical protein
MKKILFAFALLFALLLSGCLEREPEIMDGAPWKTIPRTPPIILK